MTQQNAEIITTTPALARPVRVISENNETMIVGYIKSSKNVTTLVTPEDFKEAARILNELGRSRTFAKDAALELGRPFRDESARIKAEADKLIVQIEPEEKRISDLMVDYRKREEAANQAAIAEAQRLAIEAQQRQEVAASTIEMSGDDAGFNTAAKAFEDGMAAAELSREAAARVTTAVKAKGAKEKQKATILSHNLKLVPIAYLKLDEAKVLKHIEDGTLTTEDAWVTFKLETVFKGTGR